MKATQYFLLGSLVTCGVFAIVFLSLNIFDVQPNIPDVVNSISPGACKVRHWNERSGKQAYPYEKAYDFVCDDNGRVDDANITKSDEGLYSVWSRGTGYGDYYTLNDAKKQAERIVKLKGI